MSQTVITTAFEALKAQQAAANTPVVLDEFVFANVPNLNITDPIDPAEAMPTAGQIVHRASVGKTGVVNANAVVYSITLGADVGDFSFNWVGLRDKTSNTLAMIVHAPLQQKVKNNAGTQGNVLTRSFLMEYDGAKKETQITTPAGTWQIDFTARLAGMDERHRVENIDVYGTGAFIGDGFLVKRSGNNYSVTAGTGYVGGLRAVLAAEQALTVATKPVKVWVDTSFTGTLTSVWQVNTTITLADTLADYVKNDVNHYVFAVAQINADGSVTDLRPKGSKGEQQANNDFLRKDKNLSDLSDPAESRKSLQLGSGATANVQTSREDTTPDRIVINGNALAVRSAVASGVAGSFATDANNLPENSVSFVYASATHSPGFESSVMDFSGLGGRYNVQLAASYMQQGLVKLRTKNGDSDTWNNWTTFYTTDNKPTADDVGALPSDGTAVAAKKLETARKINTVAFDGSRDITLSPANIGALSAAGGDVTGPVTFKNNSASYPVTLEGGSPTIVFSETDSGKKFYLVADGTAIRLQEDNTGDGKTAFSWDGNTLGTSGRLSAIGTMDITGPVPTIALNESDTGKTILLVMDGASIRLQEDNTGGREIFSWSTPQGALSTAGTFNASVVYESGSRVYSPRNPQPQQDLSPYATIAWANIDLRNDIYNWANGRFMQGLRFGAVENAVIYRALGYNDQLGYVITGVVNNSPTTPDDIVDIIQRRPLQININGSWMNVGQ
ncbi:phage tail protein [Escherichia coli]|uniref:phage tail-collar fiber domain-containing protein n=1 Tax=Escherichia coli TaxID=562 RepID=UPI0002A45129|nr:phage tail protein [Escherichia coli]ELD68693.1 hypothetical protein A193_03364 [Escherichia coli KTE234]